jgi:hypothetical protein
MAVAHSFTVTSLPGASGSTSVRQASSPEVRKAATAERVHDCGDEEPRAFADHNSFNQMLRISIFIGSPTCIWKPISPAKRSILRVVVNHDARDGAVEDLHDRVAARD